MNSDDFKPGDEVTVIDGSYSSFSGTIESREGDMLLVRLIIFGRVADAIPIDPHDLHHKPIER
jgi:transcription antitermination factor NusG